MNLRTLSVALLMSLSSMAVAQEFRVVTYNIRQGKGQVELHTPAVSLDLPFGIKIRVPSKPIPIARGKGQLDKIANEMRDLDADVITFQEANDRSLQTLGRDQAGYIAKKLGMKHAYATAHIDGWVAKRQGNAVLSRHPIVEEVTIVLSPAQGEHERRIALFARVMIPGYANGVWVCSTHVEAGSAEIREASTPKFIAALSRFKEPVILTGDFNASPDSQSMKELFDGAKAQGRELTDAFGKVGVGPGGTSSAPQGNSRIDYILSTPEMTPVHAFSPRDINESDHFAVVATLKAATPSPAAEAVTTAATSSESLLGVSMLGAR